MQTTEVAAGRELDALIEERIFGNAVDHEFDEPIVKARRDQYDEWGVLPAYSTDIAAAWEVVEHMQVAEADGWKHTLHLIVYPYGRTYAHFGLDQPDDGEWAEGNNRYDEQDTQIEQATPLAICRAALLAIDRAP